MAGPNLMSPVLATCDLLLKNPQLSTTNNTTLSFFLLKQYNSILVYAVALKLGWESFATRKGPTRLESGLVDEPRQGHRITGWETKKKIFIHTHFRHT